MQIKLPRIKKKKKDKKTKQIQAYASPPPQIKLALG